MTEASPTVQETVSRTCARLIAAARNGIVTGMNVTLDLATPTASPILDRLRQLYEYDFSEYGGIDVDSTGLFPTVATRAIWGPNDHVFLIRVGSSLAGFALVTRHRSYLGDGDAHLLSELFVM